MSEVHEYHPLDTNAFERPPSLTKAQARAARRAERTAKQQEHRAPPLVALNEAQQDYIDILRENRSVIVLGPAGTGKTYIAGRIAAQRKLKGEIEKIIVTRVNVSKKEFALGHLPGDLNAKMKPWMVPIMEGIRSEVSAKIMEDWKSKGEFEIVPFEFMRGRTFSDAVVILDEAQNASFSALEMFVTRTGTNSQVIICGDPNQVDIPDSGLEDIADIAEEDEIVDTMEFTEDDVVRSAEAKAWVKGIAKYKRKREARLEAERRARMAALDQAGGNLDAMPRFMQPA